VDRRHSGKRALSHLDQAAQEGEASPDEDYGLEEDALHASDAKFAIGPAPQSHRFDGLGTSGQQSRAQPESSVTLTDVHLRGQSPASYLQHVPSQVDDSTATIHLQTYINASQRPEQRPAASSPFIASQAEGSAHVHPTDTANRMPAVATRKLQPLPARHRSGQHVLNFAATVHSSQQMEIASQQTDPIERGMRHYGSGGPAGSGFAA
jgi:hypothetical protein